MMFPYSDYKTSSEYGLRWYHTPHGPLPSITTVLGMSEPPEKKAALKRWQDSLGPMAAAQKSKEATDHGTAVHLLAERFLKGEELLAPDENGKPIPQQAIGAFNALKMKLKNINSVWGQEQSIYSPTLEVAGRFDCVGEYKGVPSIIDFKTSSRVKTDADIYSYKLQLCFYAFAHNELFDTEICRGVILMASGTGMPQEFVVNIEDHVEDLVRRIHTFYTALESKLGAK